AIVKQRVGVEYTPRRKGGGSGFWQKRGGIYLMVAILLCLLTGAGVLWYKNALPDSPEKKNIRAGQAARSSSGEAVPVASPAQTLTPRPAAKPEAAKKHIKPEPAPRPGDAGIPGRSRKKTLARQTSREKNRLQQQGLKQKPPQVVAEKHHSSSPSVDVSRPGKDRTMAKPVSEKNIRSDADNHEPWQDASPLADKKMKLQALAWSSQPRKRMVVIDGQVIREGDDVNGYAVAKIRKKDIILQKSGQYYKLAFRR
ncbi:MAG: hypothetical protein DSY89_06185, partial [Deltaproteobacteria bacterium]